ncbi:unnamed protein product [Meloidogyne enterolobii]|uniref:Uncharacterized protein n=1 Tax=Meloidogyne enterolobii TaxID=390850 RepID=A0ACB1A0K1_MELEN
MKVFWCFDKSVFFKRYFVVLFCCYFPPSDVFRIVFNTFLLLLEILNNYLLFLKFKKFVRKVVFKILYLFFKKLNKNILNFLMFLKVSLKKFLVLKSFCLKKFLAFCFLLFNTSFQHGI